MECSRYVRSVQDLLSDGKTPHDRRFANVEYHPISAQDQARFHQYGKKLLPGFFMGCALHAGGRRSWKGDLFVADVEELQDKDAPEVY